MIQEFILIKKPNFQVHNYVGNRPWNNARILGENLYLPDLELFEEAFLCMNAPSTGEYLAEIQRVVEKEDWEDPFEALSLMCRR